MKKKTGIIIIMMLGIMVAFCTSVMAYGDVEKIAPEVRNMLEYDEVFTSITRTLGYWIYNTLRMFSGMCESGFNSLAQYDIMQLEVIQNIKVNMDVVLYSVLFIGFIIVVLIRMFNLENQFKTIFNVAISLVFISIFVVVLGIMTNVKTALISEIDNVVGKTNNEMIAEKMYKADTVDLLKSIKANKLVYLKDIEGLNLDYHDNSIRIKKADLNEKIIGVNNDGSYEIETLQDGVFGYGDVRYYRYRTDYFALNITLGITIIIYIFAMFKMSYLLYQWLQVNLFGTLAMGQGFMDFKKVSITYKSALMTLVGEAILYFSMMLFSPLSNAIMLEGALNGNWLLQAILIFTIGMAIVMGTGFINDKLGVDDGSQFALKSVFMAPRMTKMMLSPFRSVSRTSKKMGNVISDTYKNNSGMDDSTNTSHNHKWQNDNETSNHGNSMNDLNDNPNTTRTKQPKTESEPSWKQAMNEVNQDTRQAKRYSGSYSNADKTESEPSWKKEYENSRTNFKDLNPRSDQNESKNYSDRKDNDSKVNSIEYTGLKSPRNQGRMQKVNEQRVKERRNYDDMEIENFNSNKTKSEEVFESERKVLKIGKRGINNGNHTKEK